MSNLNSFKWIVADPPKKSGEYVVTRVLPSGCRILDTARFSLNLQDEGGSDDFNGISRSGWYKFDSEWGYYEITSVIAWIDLSYYKDDEVTDHEKKELIDVVMNSGEGYNDPENSSYYDKTILGELKRRAPRMDNNDLVEFLYESGLVDTIREYDGESYILNYLNTH